MDQRNKVADVDEWKTIPGVIVKYETIWIEKHELRCRVRKVGDFDKLMVDVTEMSEGRTSVARSQTVARQLANTYNVRNFAPVKISDIEIDRKVHRADGTVHRIRIRQSTYAFEGPIQ